MDFQLSPEQQMVQHTAREFADREIRPFIREWDERGQMDPSVIGKMGDLGLLGAPIPELYGGGGTDYISFGLMCQEMERADTAFRELLTVHTGLNSLSILQWGTEEQKQKYLVPQATGQKLAAYALTEPNVGSDAGNLETSATRDGDYYLLNGEKLWISLADRADNFLIFATVDRALKHRGITCFIVERDTPGLTTSTIHGKLGVRAGNTGGISLQDVRVPRENVLGEVGEGFRIAMGALDTGRFTAAAGAVGLAEACLEASVKYANEREAFGQPIGRFQLVQQMIAKMVDGIESSRLLAYRAGDLMNRGLRCTREASLAKWHACDVAMQAAMDAVQIHGAYGYSSDFPLERYMRNAKAAVIYEGTAQIQTILQGEYALGYREDKPLRCPLPKAPGY